MPKVRFVPVPLPVTYVEVLVDVGGFTDNRDIDSIAVYRFSPDTPDDRIYAWLQTEEFDGEDLTLDTVKGLVLSIRRGNDVPLITVA